jgi:hypothetical protein
VGRRGVPARNHGRISDNYLLLMMLGGIEEQAQAFSLAVTHNVRQRRV